MPPSSKGGAGGGNATPTNAENAEKEKKGWTEHRTKDGREFWHNSVTGVSTWDKPDCLKTEFEKLLSQQTPWRRYTMADGRVYWHNQTTKVSVWKVPEEVALLQKELEEKWPVFSDKPLAREKLKILMKQKGLALRTKWEEALNLIRDDERFKCFAILSNGEKKQCFSEYQTQLQKQQREKDRAKKVEARDALIEAAHSWEGAHPAALYSDFIEAHSEEPWNSYLDSKEKEDLFNDVMEEIEPEFLAKERKRREKLREEIAAKLTELSDVEEIAFDWPWLQAKTKLPQIDPVFGQAEPLELLSCWGDFVRRRLRQEEETRAQQLHAIRRKRRDAFVQFLEKLKKGGKITPMSTWADVFDFVRKENAYLDLVGQPLSTPRELFEDLMDDVLADFDSQKTLVKSLISEAGVKITPALTYDEFLSTLKSVEGSELIPQSSLQHTYNYLIQRATHKAKKASSTHEEERDRRGGERKRRRRDTERSAERSRSADPGDESDLVTHHCDESHRERRRSHRKDSGGGGDSPSDASLLGTLQQTSRSSRRSEGARRDTSAESVSQERGRKHQVLRGDSTKDSAGRTHAQKVRNVLEPENTSDEETEEGQLASG